MVETLCNTRASLLRSPSGVSLLPSLRVYIPQTVFPWEANACSNAGETTVFPTEVSVPVIKKRFSITNSTVMLHKYKPGKIINLESLSYAFLAQIEIAQILVEQLKMLTLQQTNQQRTVIHRVFYQRSACHRALVRKLSTLNANVLTIRRKGPADGCCPR